MGSQDDAVLDEIIGNIWFAVKNIEVDSAAAIEQFCVLRDDVYGRPHERLIGVRRGRPKDFTYPQSYAERLQAIGNTSLKNC